MSAGPTAIGDFNGDGYLDLLLTYSEGGEPNVPKTAPVKGRMVLLAGNADGNFTDLSATLPSKGVFNAAVRKIAVGDFNGDGKDDVVMALNYERGRDASNAETNAAPQVALMSGNGALHAVKLGFTTWGHSLAVGDLNNDGRDDFILGGFTGKGTASFIQNADGTLAQTFLQGRGGSNEGIGDFDGDGHSEIIDAYTQYGEAGKITGQGLRITHLNSDGSLSSEQLYANTEFKTEAGMAFNGPTTYVIVKDQATGKEYIDGGLAEFAIGDINGDGIVDIVSNHAAAAKDYSSGHLMPGKSSDFWEFYTLGKNGLEHIAATVKGYTPADHGTFGYRLLDWNGDGHLDLYVPSNEPVANNKQQLAQILINDGLGHFVRIPTKYLPDETAGYWQVGEPIDANHDGIMDLLVRLDTYSYDWSSMGTQSEKLYLGTQRFFTGPGYTNPALKGAAGFNEQYYLNTHADAKSAVQAGTYTSGLEHYLAVGKANGYFGFAANTHVYGSDNADTIVLREGNEVADGGKGNDTLLGGKGADRLIGGSGSDTSSYATSKSAVTVDLDKPSHNTGEAKGDTFSLIENLTGSKYADTLVGNSKANILTGGAGSDTLRGNGGADTFVFNIKATATNIDTVVDFNVADDTMALNQKLFAALGSAVTESEFWSNSTGKAHDGSDNLIYETDTGKLFYDSNGIATGGAVQIAALAKNLHLTFHDFDVIA